MKQSGTYCSSPRQNRLHSHSGCHTSSGLGCSCYSRSEIHEVHRSFHLFHQEQKKKKKKTMKMKMASKSMNINRALAIIFSMCNHHFLRVSQSNSISEFKTQCTLKKLTHHKMKYLTGLPIILNRFVTRSWQKWKFLNSSVHQELLQCTTYIWCWFSYTAQHIHALFFSVSVK